MEPMPMRRLSTQDADFQQQLDALLAFETVNDPELVRTVDQIIADVRAHGDAQVLALTQRFDQHPAQHIDELVLHADQLAQAFAELPDDVRQALELAAERIRSFHQAQKQDGWQYTDALGNVLGQKVTPLDRVGIYVPGGKASYPSSVLMNAIPAQVAGVGEIIMVVPAPNGELNPLVLAAAHLSGVHKVFTIGGAQAVAALAYGTQASLRWTKSRGRVIALSPQPNVRCLVKSALT
jgi:histidinol dehydrogenase